LAVDHHRHGAAVVDVAIIVAIDGDTTHVITNLYHGTAGEEETAQGRGFRQGAATVAAQVDDETIYLLLVEAGELLDDVVMEIDVEARDLEYPYLLLESSLMTSSWRLT